ncbi:uncharacterized protein LOC130766104 [Actinidia eriantha]|uniref:uncharacterized protein LOC130766104 n=1 Tax=Actinidia eriantha TaxID=165200 RepID=UPI002584611B|nr:uncharacterized protein LOC130766104 [Actinidia eriantha]
MGEVKEMLSAITLKYDQIAVHVYGKHPQETPNGEVDDRMRTGSSQFQLMNGFGTSPYRDQDERRRNGNEKKIIRVENKEGFFVEKRRGWDLARSVPAFGIGPQRDVTSPQGTGSHYQAMYEQFMAGGITSEHLALMPYNI